MAMSLHFPKTQFIFTIIIIFFSISSVFALGENSTITMPNCNDRCGDIDIPFPFGTNQECYLNESFLVTCVHTHDNPPKAFLRTSNIEILNISLDGQLRVSNNIGIQCYNVYYTEPMIRLAEGLTVNNQANMFTVVGCNATGIVYGRRLIRGHYQTGCSSSCSDVEDDKGLCSGLGCCQVPIPTKVLTANTSLQISRDQPNTSVTELNNCSYAFLVEKNAFDFSPGYVSRLKSISTLPIVVDWSIGYGTCDKAQKNISSYACKSTNSRCEDNVNDYGYRCSCKDGYRGNPYFKDGCQNINECEDGKPNKCVRSAVCIDTIGNYTCKCPKGYDGDGQEDGQGCAPGQSLLLKLVAGISSGAVVVLLAACWLYMELNRRKLVRMKDKFFLQNGGLLLQERLIRRENPTQTTRLFTSAELNKATNKFHANRIIGQGGFGTVYRGLLQDKRIVAIKRSKEVDPDQVEQFINEVIVLSQINHKNVVKLLGCCLETQVPLLVYEFINNGTLFEHINNKEKARALTWDKRLTIGAESAGVLAHLHSAASPPIIHRDVKSANILLDSHFTAKVSDFGASRLVPIGQDQLSTMVQGTFGYLDPEYMQTNKLTEKSDVYSFGIVLLELLTGMKALSYDRPEEERNLASYFLSTLRQGNLFQLLEDNIVCEDNNEQLVEVALLARRCLHVRGDDRPSMKEVAMELEGLRLSKTRYSIQRGQTDVEEMEFLLPGKMKAYANSEGNSVSTGYDSMKDHIPSSMGGGR